MKKRQLKKQQFAVDAAILPELGERLIGRPAIALGEQVKNSYDADASICQIEFGDDEIIISDNGTGMSKEDFLGYWMRLGTTHKVDQATSTLGRPLTGSKGIGRLSAQFLADEMILESTSAKDGDSSIYAIIDWTNAVPGKELRTVFVEWESRRGDNIIYPGDSASGTRLTLKKLKYKWDAERLKELGHEVWMLRSPFKRPAERASTDVKNDLKTRRPEDFDIEIDAPNIKDAGAAFDETFQKVFSNWMARIQGRLESGRSKGTAVITVTFRKGYPEGAEERKSPFRTTVRLPIKPAKDDEDPTTAEEERSTEPLIDQTFFEILVFKTVGKQPSGVPVGELRKYLTQFGNVSVYDAGFRLPYYGSGRDSSGQDWLSIAADQGRRLSVSKLLPESLRTQNKYMLDLPAPGRIFGAVEINTNHERHIAEKLKSLPDGWLQIQSGRDRLKDNPAFYQLRDLIRFSLDYYANRYRLLFLENEEKGRQKESASQKYKRVGDILESNKREIPAPVFKEVKREINEALKASKTEEERIDRRFALLAPLASAGMVGLALNHEISRESNFLNRIGRQLRRVAKKHSIDELNEVADEFDEAKRRLDSLRELFSPLLSDEDKAATDRLKVRIVVDQAVRGMYALMPGVKFSKSGVPPDLRFPLGSFAEWSAVLQNILANAWNAMLDSEKAEISFCGGRDRSGREWLHVSDTGKGLDIPVSEADRLFEPFERRIEISNDKRSIAIGGQGLGLAIVRMIAHHRSATVSFVQPDNGFSTAFEIAWRGAKR